MKFIAEKKPEFETCLIVGSGPSLSRSQVEYAQGKCPIIAVNSSFLQDPTAPNTKAWFKPDVVYACDERWWIKYHSLVSCESWTRQGQWASRYGINQLKICTAVGHAHRGLSRDPCVLNAGKNSGHQAINLAYHFGAKRIILIGFDHQFTGGKTHFFGDHPLGWPNCSNIENWCNAAAELSEDLASEGVDVINCSLVTALNCFKKGRIEKCLK